MSSTISAPHGNNTMVSHATQPRLAPPPLGPVWCEPVEWMPSLLRHSTATVTNSCADFKTEAERSFQAPTNHEPVDDEYGRPVRRLYCGRIKKRVRPPHEAQGQGRAHWPHGRPPQTSKMSGHMGGAPYVHVLAHRRRICPHPPACPCWHAWVCVAWCAHTRIMSTPGSCPPIVLPRASAFSAAHASHVLRFANLCPCCVTSVAG